MSISTARQRDLVMVGVGLLVVLVDQLTKQWILAYFLTDNARPAIPILGPFLELRFIANTGVAFSLLEGQTIKFVLIALAIAAIAYLYWRSRETGSLLLKVSFGLVLGGAVGNLIDRFVRGFVVDFIHFQIPQIGFSFAVFNIADSAISIGVLLLAYLLWSSSAQESDAAAEAASGTPASSGAASEELPPFGAMVSGVTQRATQRATQAARELRERVSAALGANGANGANGGSEGPQG